MTHLPKRIPELKSGSEAITINGQPTGMTILDFWRWSASDLLSNATRGIFAEFLVRQALDITEPSLRDEWDAFDLRSAEGIKIEVKSAAYLQSWEQKDFSKISFSIKPSRAYDYKSRTYSEEIKRQADIYIFCLLAHKDQETVNPLEMEQWEFYVVPTATLNDLFDKKQRLSLSKLQTIADPMNFTQLKETVEIVKR